MKEYIDIDKCSKFEQIMLFLMTNHKENDLREEDKKVGFTSLGEIERNCRFGIDFTHIDWIQELVTLEDNDPKWELENKIQEVSMKMIELYDMIKKYDKK